MADMDRERPISNGASVKIMLSYDYCHFEVCLSDEGVHTYKAVNELRKEAQRLADEAVRQYKEAKEVNQNKCSLSSRLKELERKTSAIKENFPKSEWTPQQKAVIKSYEDLKFFMDRDYDYQDDWENWEELC